MSLKNSVGKSSLIDGDFNNVHKDVANKEEIKIGVYVKKLDKYVINQFKSHSRRLHTQYLSICRYLWKLVANLMKKIVLVELCIPKY